MKLATMCLAALLLALAPGKSAAQSYRLRVPQVPIAGDSLQRLLDANDPVGDVHTGQYVFAKQSASFDLGYWSCSWVTQPENATLCLYDAGLANPALIEVLPDAVPRFGFATAAFRHNPDRVVIALWDEFGTLLGLQFVPCAGLTGVGFAIRTPEGTSWAEDARNPGGVPHALVYRDQFYSPLFAFESSPIPPGGAGAYDDAIATIELIVGLPVHQTTWGALKARMR